MTLTLPPLALSYDSDEADMIAFEASSRKEEPMEDPAPPPAGDFACKVNGCTNQAKSNRGRYAYICEEHRGVAKPAKTTKRADAKPKTNGHVAPRDRLLILRDLLKAEQDLINARAHVGSLEQRTADLVEEFKATA